jgi:hypothetical protein
MKLVALAEFQNLLGLSDKALVWLLTHNALQCEIRPEKGICIDIDSVPVKKLQEAIIARQQEVLDRNQDLVTERLGAVVRDELETIVNEALGRFLTREV